ncbi:1-deoxy-D-xylulose-5-phosphate synthase [Amycolatopsis arida]|uniref:1-deoxy-D-xylulose-5-phosphate synthase n=1 Tax=Amycolatopsis arida TaxID=587909 RepID=A0A1I5P1V6_9PSEU|nr:1-deoxy-D-xylulose-5-phosphate synthase [Amycolatopsis arida]TDX98324.1 1-deoxy-D-xylulose-5-phosphate synthase [Amycolatopsis arida]SFP28002.1 1-deoxy-D-xylulose-5-phosphate synthase [Amycolatopsis arida]
MPGRDRRNAGEDRRGGAVGADAASGPRGPLGAVEGPVDLRALPAALLPEFAEEIRTFLVDTVTRTGGHLGSNLGMVELTIALHRVFDSPRDVVLFDTGHQAYVHKLLTGRRREFATLRQRGGLSGYPSAAESPHDRIENSHASTALSYADGLARAFSLRGTTDRRVVAVIGDGALTGGLAWEALNNLGAGPQRPVVVVLNDNGRSYDPTVGALGRHLAGLRAGAGRASSVFAELGLGYLGPVDGHDIAAVEDALRRAVRWRRPVVVHCVTRKGKGFPPAEADEADCLHAVGPAAPAATRASAAEPPSWTSVFGQELRAIGAERPDVVCLTAAMLRPTGLLPFAETYPDRVIDVGLAEQHAVAGAAGLAMGGLHPVVAVYATFLNRAFDQVLMDVALHRLPVTFVLDRAGVTGPDGASHHGMWDLSLLALVPGLRLAAPRDAGTLRELLREAVAVDSGPTAVRFPKGTTGPDVPARYRRGRCDVLLDPPDPDVLLVAVGPLAPACLAAAAELRRQGIAATVVDPRWVHPLDPSLLELAAAHRLVITVEDNTGTGGVGARLAQAAAGEQGAPRVRCLALPGEFLPHGGRGELLDEHGLTASAIAAAVRQHLPAIRLAEPGTVLAERSVP